MANSLAFPWFFPDDGLAGNFREFQRAGEIQGTAVKTGEDCVLLEENLPCLLLGKWRGNAGENGESS